MTVTPRIPSIEASGEENLNLFLFLGADLSYALLCSDSAAMGLDILPIYGS
jgi:hypothetical protein